MQKFMQILATLALLLVLALVIPLTLAACGGRRYKLSAPGIFRLPDGRKGDEMTTTAKIEELQKSVINAINNSCLHPAVVRLVLLNVISMVEASEREVNKREKETES